MKRLVAYGSLLPSWEKNFTNSPHALSDDELARCIDFMSGHMVSKLQGRLAETLAVPPLARLVAELVATSALPAGGTLVFGPDLRCRATRRTKTPTAGSTSTAGVEGPDALYVTTPGADAIAVHALVEIKSMYVAPEKLRRQGLHHLAAVARGLCVRGRWHEAGQISLASSGVLHLYVAPASWLMSRRFHWEPGEEGRELVMEDPPLPHGSDRIRCIAPNTWTVELAWSRDALRAGAFRLAHRYMAEVGEALASDTEVTMRTDMTAAEAGQNDLLHELHVAIARQADAEPDRMRRGKTIELYNVLGFGWALGHGFRGADGRPRMMHVEDLEAGPSQ